MKKRIALCICTLIFMIACSRSRTVPQDEESGYYPFWGNGSSFLGTLKYVDGENYATEEVMVNFSAVKEYENGALYAMSVEERSQKQFPDYVLERLPVYLYVKEDKIYRIFMYEEDIERIKSEAELFSDEWIGSMVICQEEGLEEGPNEGEEGEYHTIVRDENTCESHFYRLNEYENLVGYWERFYWEEENGMMQYRSGYSAEADLVEISRCETE